MIRWYVNNNNNKKPKIDRRMDILVAKDWFMDKNGHTWIAIGNKIISSYEKWLELLELTEEE